MRAAIPANGSSERQAAGWLSSLVVHLALLLALLLIVEPSFRPAGETLNFELHGGQESLDNTVLMVSDAQVAAALTAVSEAFEPIAETALALPQPRPLDPGSTQPTGGAAQTTVAAASTAAAGGRQVQLQDFRFGYAHTKLFGVPGEGFRFVYVFDRSGSMGGSGRSALEVAKAELLASLEPLERTHQFQIVFYNEAPQTFSITGQRGRLVYASEANKRSAAQFIRGVSATGTTRHEEALASALAYFPDVIYLLTDADEPSMTAAELARITRLNGDRTVIHAIEFGLGPHGHSENFLTRLAAQNGGQHVYIDFSTWNPRQRAADPAGPGKAAP